MPNKRVVFNDLDNLIKRYISGESILSLATEQGRSHAALQRAFSEAGVIIRSAQQARIIRGKASRMEIPNLAELIERYEGGESIKSISDQTGIERTVLTPRFRERGVKLRCSSEAELLKWSTIKSDPAAVQRQCSGAWEAARGRIRSEEEKAKGALTKFYRQRHIYKMEDEVAAFLATAGFPVQQQFPVGPYNLDISTTAPPIAVEVNHLGASDFNGRPKTGNRPYHEKLKYLLDRQWFVIYLMATGAGPRRTIDLAIAGDELIAAMKQASSDKAMFGKYRVIWGQGEPPPKARYNFNNLPRVG